jgi:hypothetical protein
MKIEVLLFFLALYIVQGTIFVRETNQTFSKAVVCHTFNRAKDPIIFGNITGRLVFENATKDEKNGSIILVVHVDPINIKFNKIMDGLSAHEVKGLITISLEADYPGKGGFEVQNAHKYDFPPWVDVAAGSGSQLMKLALKKNYTVTFNDKEINPWRTFGSSGGLVFLQILVIAPNLVIVSLSAYIALIIGRQSRNYLYIVNIIFESIGAVARIIYFFDPMASYRLVDSQVNAALFIFMLPFGLMNCLLLALYLHESMHLKDVKVNTFITPKTQRLFYVFCAIIFLFMILIPILKATPIYDTFRLVGVIFMACVAVAIGIFYSVTASAILNALKQMQSKKSKRRQAAGRFIATSVSLFLTAVVFIITRLPPARSPTGYYVFLTIFACCLTSVGLINIISLLLLNNKTKNVTTTKQTGTTVLSSSSDDV